jgi:hypothetical protein
MQRRTQQVRSPSGDVLPAELLEQLREALRTLEARELGVLCGLSEYTISRAAAGGRVMRASRAAIQAGLQRAPKESS